MSKPKISRQKRALLIAESRFERWSSAKTAEDAEKILGFSFLDPIPDKELQRFIEKQANKASIEVTNLKKKLQGVAQ